jgi:hypothetical protein
VKVAKVYLQTAVSQIVVKANHHKAKAHKVCLRILLKVVRAIHPNQKVPKVIQAKATVAHRNQKALKVFQLTLQTVVRVIVHKASHQIAH